MTAVGDGWIELCAEHCETPSLMAPCTGTEGHEVIAAQYGLDMLAGDVAAVRSIWTWISMARGSVNWCGWRLVLLQIDPGSSGVKSALGRVSSPVILVGHSYGGTLITSAGVDPRVAGLVYIAALAPDSDETSQSQQSKFAATEVFSHVEVADGRVWMKPDGIATFAGDLPEQEQKVVWATHAAPAADLFAQKIEGTAWKSKPSWYIVANKDRTVQPELQRFVAKRMGAITFETDSSHVPMLSQPGFVLDVIRKAAKAVQNA
jgi:pimeloyl-ACP methyl ester carboxylesterase